MCARLASSEAPLPRRFSRPWFTDQLRNLAWVAAITCLVWVYADLHFTVTEDVKARLVITTASAANPMVVMGPTEFRVSFRVKGNQHAITRLRNSRLEYDAAAELGPGVHRDLSTAAVLGRVDALRDAPVKIMAVEEPETITVTIEETQRFAGVPVEPDYFGGEPGAPPRIAPDRVDLYVPVSQLGRVEPDPRLRVRVDLTDYDPGEPVSRRFAVLPPARVAEAIVRPSEVVVTLTVARQPARRKLTVAVDVQMPKDWLGGDFWGRYLLEGKDGRLEWTKDITVTGNRFDLEKLRPEDVRAYILLTEGDKRPVESWLERRVRIEFPKGLDVRAESVPTVSFRLRERSEAGGAP